MGFVSVARLIDKYIGAFLIIIINIFKKRKPLTTHNDVLFIKLWAVGESVLTLNLIKEFKERNKKSKVTVLCSARNVAIFKGHKFIDEVKVLGDLALGDIITDIKHYDLAFDLEPYINLSALYSFWFAKRSIGYSHGLRSILYDWRVRYNDKQHIMLTYLDLLEPFGYKIKKPKSLIKLNYSKSDQLVADEVLKSVKKRGKKLVGFTITVAETSPYRQWPAERFVTLGNKLVKKNCIIAIPDIAKQDKSVDLVTSKIGEGSVNLAGSLNLPQLFRFIEKADLWISNDTGPMHIAAAMGVKTIGLFGPNTPVRFAPYGQGNISIYKCNHEPYINPHLGSFKEPHHYCMNKIKVGDVLEAAEKLLKKQ